MRKEMTNLLQENIENEINCQRTNSTFGFLPTHRQKLKNQKSFFFSNAREETNRKSNFENE
jgi:hypothetical protein